MTRRRFYFQLVGLTLGLIILVLLTEFIPVLKPHLIFSLASVAVFAFITILLFSLGVKTAVSKDKNAFTRVVMASTFLKMFLAIIVVIAYHKLTNPEEAFFVIPFFVIYFTYTIFETSFLSKLGKIKAH